MNIKSIKKNHIYGRWAGCVHYFTAKLNPRLEARRCYKTVFGREPDLDNPKDLIEKIYWLQFNTDTSLWTKCADKYKMREYVEQCGYDSYLPTLLGKWDDANDIDFNILPDSFVLKTNNGCGTVYIVKDKTNLNEEKTRRMIKQWLALSFGWSGAQLHYTRIKPCVIAEELISKEPEHELFSPDSMVDYKVWCINGKPENILVVYNRNKEGYSLDLYDTGWCRMSDKLEKNGHYFFHDTEIPKPACLQEMLEISKSLSKPFPEVRVDFYVSNGSPVIGELTFTTGYGYFTNEYYLYLGNLINIRDQKCK